MPDQTNQQQTITLLGTGTSVGVPVLGCDCDVCTSTNPKNNRLRSGVLVEATAGNFLIDTPPDLRTQLLREHVKQVQAVLFTHSHADHIFGLDDLRIFGHRQDIDITLYCEAFVEQELRKSFHYAFNTPTAAHKFAIPRLTFQEIALKPFTVLNQQVQPIRLLHGKLEILGFRINDVAFCTDVSEIPEESWPLLEGLDTLVLDCLRDTPHPTHFSVQQSLETVERLQPKQAYFTHVSHSLEYVATNARLPAGVELAYDGLKIPF